MAAITLDNLAHSYLANPKTDADFALKQIDYVWEDSDVTTLSPEQRNIAQVFQFPVIYDTMTVAQNLAFPLVNRGVAKSEVNKRVQDMLVTLDLSEKANRRAKGLTADEKQKISLGV